MRLLVPLVFHQGNFSFLITNLGKKMHQASILFYRRGSDIHPVMYTEADFKVFPPIMISIYKNIIAYVIMQSKLFRLHLNKFTLSNYEPQLIFVLTNGK